METLRILLGGEASGTHHLLKVALEQLGHEAVHVVSAPLAQGRPPPDMITYQGARRTTGRRRDEWSESRINIKAITSLGRFDAVNLMMDASLMPHRQDYMRDLAALRRRTKSFTFYAVGCDPVALPRLRNDFPVRPCEGCLEQDALGVSCSETIYPSHAAVTVRLRRVLDGVITFAVDFDHATRDMKGVALHAIPLPIAPLNAPDPNWDGISRTVSHGSTRPGFKGTPRIMQAFDIARKSAPAVDFQLLSGLTHGEFLQRLASTHILVDQLSAQSCGVAALEAMSAGRVVVGGNSPRGQAFFPFGHENPAVNAPTDAATLAQVISTLLADPLRCRDLGQRGRRFVREHHDPKRVAKEFVSLWSQHKRSLGTTIFGRRR